jgi:hypothetical protein
MKLGVTYNIFDGEEMLFFSLRNLRPMVQHINVVYQTTSNFGNENPNLEEALLKYERAGLIDFLHKYEPTLKKNEDGSLRWQNGQENEINKRNIGLQICRANGCDVMMTLDCDELYDPNEFKWAKDDFELGDYDTSFCKMSTYYKEPIYRLYPKEEYYAPLFYKIKKDTQFGYESADYPVVLDPTRKVKAGYARIYEREEIEMHHYAYVRNDISSKVINSSSQSDEISKKKVIWHYNNFKDIRDSALMIGGVGHGLIRVENKFDIQL